MRATFPPFLAWLSLRPISGDGGDSDSGVDGKPDEIPSCGVGIVCRDWERIDGSFP